MNGRRREMLKMALLAASAPLASGAYKNVQARGEAGDETREGAREGARERRELMPRAARDDDGMIIPLWPRGFFTPGSGPQGPEQVSHHGAVKNVSQPRLIVYPAARPNGAATLVSAGGGYAHIERGQESTPACKWLQSIGVTAFELVYRLPDEGWVRDAPLQDGQRAMRIVRSLAERMQFSRERIGVLGFSAGGHLSGITETTPEIERYAKVDEIDGLSSAPDFAGLIYPVLTLLPPFDNTHTRRSIVGKDASREAEAALSVERLVTPRTPPTFLAQAKDDPISNVENSKQMFKALREVHVPAQIHLFETGGHGWGMGRPGTEETAWPGLFETWATNSGWWTAS